MAIADRINEMYTHVGDVYDTLEVGGAQIYTLPNEFTQVDYIQSSGTQYIDTGFEANYNTRVVIDFIANQRSDAWLLGSRISYGENNYSVLLWNGGNLRTDYNTGGQDMGASINTRYILDKNKNVSTLYQNGTQVSRITATYSEFNSNHNMYLFACNNNGSVSAMANVKMFSCKIYDNGTLIRDFIPCYRNSDNVIGLYDIVEGNFYTNKGTGAFTYGSVSREHIDKNIININDQLKDRLIDYMNNGTEKIWNNWEKVTGSGTDISLSPTLEAPMKNVLNGNTYQFTTTGKNLLPNNQTTQTINGLTFTVNDDKSITIRGTATANTDYYFVGTTSQYVDFGLTTGTYNLSGCSGGSEQTYMLFAVMNRNGSIYYYGSFVDTGRKMIVETGDTFRIFIRVISGQTMNTTMYPMVERGDNKTTYEPYTGGVVPRPEYPEDIHVVSGNNEINVLGKNLLNPNTNITNIYFNPSTKQFQSNANNRSIVIPIKPNTTYTISRTEGYGNDFSIGTSANYPTSGEYATNISVKWSTSILTNTITSGANDKYLLFYFGYQTSESTSREWLAKTQLEIGEQASTYEPYNGNTYSINLPIENLCNVSNTITTSAFGMNVTLSEDVVTCSGTPTRQYINTEAVNLINPLKAGNTYNFMAFSDNLPSECNFRIWGYNSDNVLKFNVKSGASLLITEDIIKYRLVLEGMTTGTSYNIQAKLQLEKGDKFNSYTPYGMEPIKMCNLNTYKDYFLRNSSKNLCNTTFELGGIDTTTGQDGAGTDRVRTKDYVEIKPNTTYTLSGIQGSRVVCFYNSSKAYLSYEVVGSQSTSGTFTTPNNVYFMRWYIIQTNTNINEMLNEGSTALPYEPYGSGEWYKCNQLSKYVLDGTQNIPLASSTPRRFNASYTTLGITNTKDGASATETQANYRMCDHFSYTSGNTTWGNYYLHNNWLVILDSESVIADANALKTWLSNNNTIIYYVLATPTYNKITYEPLLEQLETFYNAKSKNSQTNISQENNDLPFILDVTALKQLTQ